MICCPLVKWGFGRFNNNLFLWTSLMAYFLALIIFFNVLERGMRMAWPAFATVPSLVIRRIWRINIGVALILALNYLSLWLEPQCQPGGVLEKICGAGA